MAANCFRLFSVVLLNNRCRSVPSQTSQHQLRHPSFSPSNSTHNAGLFRSCFSAFCLYRILCWVRNTILSFASRPFALVRCCYCCRNDCCFTTPRKCRFLFRRLSAVHFSLPLLSYLSPCTTFLLFYSSFTSTLCSPFTLPVTFCSRCISSEEPEVCY